VLVLGRTCLVSVLAAAASIAGCSEDESLGARRGKVADAGSQPDVSVAGSGGTNGGTGAPDGSTKPPGGQSTLYNREAVIPPMCYTETRGNYNPCYVCHQTSVRGEGRANFMNDGVLQGDYGFSDLGTTNHWQNLFENREREVLAISDSEIDTWVSEDNYTELPGRLAGAGFRGWVPDLKNLEQAGAAFDAQGLARDGSGWVAFKYKPLPSTFWPTNGATDDVMIRLPAKFRNDSAGRFSRDVYFANLAIVEASIKNLSEISVPPVSESAVGVDLNGDGTRGTVGRIERSAHYVGQASAVPAVTFLYPEGVEFLHTVRYLNVLPGGKIGISRRMKEVRYMRKWKFYDKVTLAVFYGDELQEKLEGNLPYYSDRADNGVRNKMGWDVSGFIEDGQGKLRPLAYEENLFCMGCHSSVGSTIDDTFAFPRKVTGARGFGYIDLEGMADAPNLGEERGEIRTYLERAGGGSEFRHNDEMQARWFNADGSLNVAKVQAARDVYELVTPSPERARLLNKAYRVLVEQQAFIKGRDPTASPPLNVLAAVDPDTAPVLPTDRQFAWDLRLAWPDR
jgi:hypothetical protein